MTLLKFYFGLNLNQRFYAITGNLSKTLQKGKMSALRGKVLIDLIVQTLKNMRNEHEFSLLYKNIKVLASEIDAISPPSLPRKWRKLNYSILYYVTGNSEATAASQYPENRYEHYRLIILLLTPSKIDLINQPTFKLFTQADQLLLKAMGKQDVTDELKVSGDTFQRWLWYQFTHFRAWTTSNDLRMWAHQLKKSSQSVKVIVTRKTHLDQELRDRHKNYRDCRRYFCNIWEVLFKVEKD